MSTAVLGLMIVLASNMEARATPAVTSNVTTTSRGSVIPDYTIGWDFEVDQEIDVTHLGFFDMLETSAGSIGDGLFEAHQIGIWKEDGTLVASGTVAAGQAATLIDDFRYVAITSTTLVPNETYLIGAHFPSSCSLTTGSTGDCSVTHVPGDLFNPSKFKWDAILRPGVRRWGVGFSAPLGTGTRPGFGPTFLFTPGQTPPPPPSAPPGMVILQDPAGDPFFFNGPLPPGSPEAPDLLKLQAGFTSTDLMVSVTFAAGTMQPGTAGTLYIMGLDTDLNLTTGGSFVPGADKILFFASDLTFATICDEYVSLPTCPNQVPITLQGDQLQMTIPLDASGINDDGVVRFGFVAGLFLSGLPASEDSAFDGVSGSLVRNLTVTSGNLEAPPLPVPGLGGAGKFALVLALVAMALVMTRNHKLKWRRPQP
jgi:hypothetical protein